MGKHKSDNNPQSMSVEDLLAAFKEMGLRAEVVDVATKGTTRVHSSRFPGNGVRWGAKDHLFNQDGTPCSHMTQILVDAAESDQPVEISLSNGKLLLGRVISVSAEIFCLEVWEHVENGGPEGACAIVLPEHAQQAYIDINAVDALIDIPGFWPEDLDKPDEDPDRTKDLSGEPV